MTPLLRFYPARMEPVQHDQAAQCCPRCGGIVHRSRSRNWSERLLKALRWERLYRCDGCEWRGWLVPMTFARGEVPEATAPVDLSGLDTDSGGLVPPSTRTERSRRRRKRRR